jgi:flavin reductase
VPEPRTPHEITPEEFRRALGLFATGVTVVTTEHENTLHGMTANAFASVSIDPLLVLVCVGLEAGLHELLPLSKRFAVTVLAHDQHALSEWFASPRRPLGDDQFNEVRWFPAPFTGCPVLEGGLAYVDCRVTDVLAGGDHSIFLGDVIDLAVLRDTDPLVFFAGGYHRLVIELGP